MKTPYCDIVLRPEEFALLASRSIKRIDREATPAMRALLLGPEYVNYRFILEGSTVLTKKTAIVMPWVPCYPTHAILPEYGNEWRWTIGIPAVDHSTPWEVLVYGVRITRPKPITDGA
jgi:hypothetical protein